MKKLVDVRTISKKEWLLYRKQGITGTDAGAIVGMNPFKSAFEVYQDKITDDIEEFDNEAMRQGRDLENYVAQRFAEEYHMKVRRANYIYCNEENPYMLADFDRLIVGQKAGLECKTVSAYSADKWQDGKIPLHYLMQVQHYLAVSGFDCWYIAALIMGKEFIVRKIERDEELITYLMTIEKNFWYGNVLAKVMPDPDGTEACSQAISKMYFKSNNEKTVSLVGFRDALKRRQEIDVLLKKMEKEKAAIEQRIKLEMQDAAYAVADDYKISWASFTQTRLDSKKLKEEQPEIYEKYVKTCNSRRFAINHVA